MGVEFESFERCRLRCECCGDTLRVYTTDSLAKVIEQIGWGIDVAYTEGKTLPRLALYCNGCLWMPWEVAIAEDEAISHVRIASA